MSSSYNNTDHSNELGHIIPYRIYRNICLALFVLTIITVAISRVDFGILNIIVAMVIASIKAVLVMLFFMHLKYEHPLTWFFAVFPFFLLFLLIGGVMIDNPFRFVP